MRFPVFECKHSPNGEDAVQKVSQACLGDNPYCIVIIELELGRINNSFVYPREIRKIDSRIQIIIPFSPENEFWQEMSGRYGKRDFVLFQQKPYQPIELQQCAVVLFEKWRKNLMTLRTSSSSEEYDQVLKEKIQSDLANKAKSDLLSKVSHEIKTPLNALMGVHSLLANTELNDEQKQFVEIAERSSKNLLDLVENVLALFRAESGHETLYNVELNPDIFFQHIFDLFKFKAQKSNIDFLTSVSETIPKVAYADTRKLKVIMNNLIDNAIKFSKGGTVSVSIDAQSTETEDGKFYIRGTVSDTGIGIPQDELDNIFSQFVQVKGPNSHLGSGVGLNTTHQYVKLMEGSIKATSQEQKGTRFSFVLPLWMKPSH